MNEVSIINRPQRSQLWVVGWLLILANVLGQTVVRRVMELLPPDSALRLTLSVGTDLLSVACFAGLACVIIGGLRNRKWRKEWERTRIPLGPRPNS